MTGPGPARGARVAGGIAGAALLVAVVTVVARAVGFGRWIVFSKTVEGGCLADAYNTANLLPNVLFEVVAGGALAAAVIPVLAGPAGRGDRETTGRTVSALLTWSLLLLVPVALVAAALAGPLVRLFLGTDADCPPGTDDAGVRMLLLFLPQLFCYAAAVVLSGALQAHRRFLAAALAPLVSSAVVIGAYVAFAALADGTVDVDAVPRSAETTLALGTTLGVAALALTVAVPVAATGLRLRPTLAFPPGVAGRVRALAAAGVAVLIAQQGCLLAVAWLANHRGEAGAITAYTWAWAVYVLPYAVLAVPIATSAFPRMAALAEAGDAPGSRALAASTTRAVVLASAAGAAAIAAGAVPVARIFAAGAGVADADALADGIAALAPGLVGYGLVAHLGRFLYAAHEGRRAAVATVVGWAAVVVADVVLVAAVPSGDTVAALAAGNSVGMTVAGLLLCVAVARTAGPGALAGLGRTLAAAVLAAAVATAAGRGAAHALDGDGFADAGFGTALAASAVLALVAAAVFTVVAAAADRDTLRRVARRADR